MNRYTVVAVTNTKEKELRTLTLLSQYELTKGAIVKIANLQHTIKFVNKEENQRPHFGDVIIESKPTTKQTK